MLPRQEFLNGLHNKLTNALPFKDERPIIDCIESMALGLLADGIDQVTILRAVNTYLDAYANNQ